MSEREAEEYLLALERFGMRCGVPRMRRLMGLLGEPQRRYATIHVVGTNGKSSTVRMIAALLARHGLRAGAYVSPHLVSFTERIRIDDADISGERFAAHVARAREAAIEVDRDEDPDDRITQFAVLTAAAYGAFAEAAVDVAVVEAGLGGRGDLTNVMPSEVHVLTNVALEHTKWLGDTVEAIAESKLGVVADSGASRALVVGADLDATTRRIARRVAVDAGVELVVAPARVPEDVELRARGVFQQRNYALACAAAATYLERDLDPAAIRDAAAAVAVPGRFDVIGAEGDLLVDGAHNVAAAQALAESLPDRLAGRELTLLFGVLDDKDARGMLAALLPLATHVVLTMPANPRAVPAGALAELAAELGRADVILERDPRTALRRVRAIAQGSAGVALVTGSLYLLADIMRPEDGREGSTL